MMGTITATTARAISPARSRLRTHHSWRRRSGTGRRLGTNDTVWVSPPTLRLCRYTATSTQISTRKSISPGWSM